MNGDDEGVDPHRAFINIYTFICLLISELWVVGLSGYVLTMLTSQQNII